MQTNRYRCSFCGETQARVGRLIDGSNAHICAACVVACSHIFAHDGDDAFVGTLLDTLEDALASRQKRSDPLPRAPRDDASYTPFPPPTTKEKP